jgi:hypothetical protein
MKQVVCAGRVRRFVRGVLLIATMLGIGTAGVACGQRRGAETPTGAAVPAGHAGQPSYATAPPPSLTRTPFPTFPAPIYSTPVPPEPRRPEPTFAPGRLPTPLSTPRPDDPYQLVIHADRVPNTLTSTKATTTIVIGIVRQVLPPRWDTPDGGRPANPHDRAKGYSIFRPVLVQVEQYVKGEQPQRMVQVYALGGKIGQDYVVWDSDTLNTFQEGERVALFLKEIVDGLPALNGRALFGLTDHYTIKPDGQVTNGYRTVPLQQLLDEIASAEKQP